MNITNMTKLSEMGFDFIRSEIKMVIMTIGQLEIKKIRYVILHMNDHFSKRYLLYIIYTVYVST